MIPIRRPAFAVSAFLTIITLSILTACVGGAEIRERKLEDSEISALLSSLTLRQRIGQRFIGWVPGGGFSGEVRNLVEAGEIGGFIIYKWNFDSIDDVRSLTLEMQTAAAISPAGIPLFLAADQEGGRVAAFRFDEFVKLPPAFHLARNLTVEAVEAASYVNAVQLKSIGINMNLAPVLDLYPFPDTSIIGDRSFGPDVGTTAAAGVAFVRGSIRGGVLPVVKHFPGHGLSKVDSHGDLPVIDDKEFAQHLAPFRAAIDSNAPALMPAHLLIPAVDPAYPVTLSKVFIQDILREELGFTGLVVSDGLSMGALSKHYTLEETLARCFQVGIDAILVHSVYSVVELIEMVTTLVEEGAISREAIDEGTFRVLVAKRRASILKPGAP
jgi:beta-N-acetylhexosaminidase